MSFKEQAEALTDLNPSVEMLIRLLCVIPGWNEKNVQVTHSQTYKCKVNLGFLNSIEL